MKKEPTGVPWLCEKRELGHCGPFARRAAMWAMMFGIGAASLSWAAAPQPATAPAGQGGGLPAAAQGDGPIYPVSEFVVKYAQEEAKLPNLDELYNVEVTLGESADGYVAPRDKYPTAHFRLGDAAKQAEHNYHQSALLAIDGAIVRYFNEKKGLVGIYVAQAASDIDPVSGGDLRKGDDKKMNIVVLVGVVKELRTISSGQKFPMGQRINNPEYQKITANSPVRPGEKNLLRKDALDEYISRLNRNPSRRVDVAMSAAQEPGGVALDYLITEAKPWSVYAQLSNTGTRQTSAWRERLGFLSNNLTGHDDIFSIDFITAEFDNSNAALASYELPVPRLQNLRAKVYGSWNEYVASDLGQNLGNQQFEGEETVFGGELIANVYQHKDFFLDAVGGVRYKHVFQDDISLATAPGQSNSSIQRGDGDFVIPYVGLRFERDTEQTSFRGSVTANFGYTTGGGTSQAASDKLDGLGRLNADHDWQAIQAEVSESFYLEPLLLPRQRIPYLANEVALVARGQYAFDNRLIPQEQEVLGGLYTIRGYPESFVAGDNMVMGSAEYRLHVPRLLLRHQRDANGNRIYNEPEKTRVFGEPFRWTPSEPLGKTDWDFILKAFIDAGRITQNQRDPTTERNDTLVGAGVGFELSFKQNISLRMDYGIALRDAGGEDEHVDSGDSRLHVVFTILY